MATKKKKFKFKAEMKQLLHLIINSLYTNPEIFLRELISNSSDALNKVRFMQVKGEEVHAPKLPLQIKIEVDHEKNLFSIEDTGIGMSLDDLTDRLGTVASSGTMKFMEQLKENGSKAEGDLIGKFGVGFYSAFMVTDKVTVETRHAQIDDAARKWVSDGKGTYEVEETDRTDRGTKISFVFKEEHKDFALDHKIKQLIRKYSNFVDFPILVNGEEVNSTTALWHKSKSEIKEEELNEFYKFISNDFEDPLGHLHLSMEGRINFKALLFVPKRKKPDFFRTEELTSLQLYSNRVFVQEDCKDLLPEYLRFLEGVVDSEDLPLNVSREVTQYSPVMTKIREVLVNKTLSLIEEWAEKEPETFYTFYKEFGPLFKSGLQSDFGNRDRLIELLRFQSTRTAGASDKETENESMVSLKTYAERMPEKQKEIYYLSGNRLEDILLDPRLEYFKKKNIEVLLLSDPVDAFLVPGLGTYQEKPLKSIEKADLDLDTDEEEEKDSLSGELLEQVINAFREAGKDRLEDVISSRRLVESAVTLTIGKEGMDSHLEKMMQMMDKSTGQSKKVLEINPSHPVIVKMGTYLKEQKQEMVQLMAEQLFESALLMQGDLDSPGTFVQRMNRLLEKL
ncbi:molecular chaperone HtpG [Balneolaceae bacterium ANBcel3]|nr:molecular chaperone HtpG [Balneolaceae bacterium ANBcel3]